MYYEINANILPQIRLVDTAYWNRPMCTEGGSLMNIFFIS